MPELNQEQNKYEFIKKELDKQYDFDQIEDKFKAIGWDKESNIFVSQYKRLSAEYKTTNELLEFFDFCSETNLEGVYSAPILSSLISRYSIFQAEKHREKNVPVMDERIDTSNDMIQGHPSDGLSETIGKSLDSISDEVHLTRKSTEMVLEDKTSNQVLEKVNNVYDILYSQLKTRTEKKATFEQVESVEKDTKEIKEKIDTLSKVIPANVEKWYTAVDISKAFLGGFIAGAGLFLIIFFLTRIMF